MGVIIRQIVFKYNKTKATQAILWLLHKHGGALNKLKLVKLIFYADREHLVKYGRPIAGGSYVAMPHGPASSELLNHINAASIPEDTPFVSEELKVLAKTSVDEDKLSESDIEMLSQIDSEYGIHGRFVLRDLTHDLKAWKQNYPNPKENTSHPLPYEDFFLDFTDKSMLDIIRDNQEAWAGLE